MARKAATFRNVCKKSREMYVSLVNECVFRK